MACSYTFQPTFSTVAPVAGYASPINVESLLRNKVDIYSTLPVERSLVNNTIPTPFVNAPIVPTPFGVAPVERCVETGRVYGAECGARIAHIVAARLNTFVGQEIAVRIGAQWGAEVCAKLAAELAIRPVSNPIELEQVIRHCAVYGAEHGAQLGAAIAKTLNGYPMVELAARLGAEIFSEICAKLCCDINGRTWNSRVHHDKLYNVAFRPSSEVELYTLTNPIRVLDVEGNRQLYLCFELKSFKPEEVTVTLNKAERAVQIEAVHDVKEGKEHAISRKYSRKFVLPESLSKIDLTKVELKSFVNAEGYLIVEAQLPKMTAEEIAKCPTMSHMYNNMPFAGFNGINSINCNVNTVKPVTVKTA